MWDPLFIMLINEPWHVISNDVEFCAFYLFIFCLFTLSVMFISVSCIFSHLCLSRSTLLSPQFSVQILYHVWYLPLALHSWPNTEPVIHSQSKLYLIISLIFNCRGTCSSTSTRIYIFPFSFHLYHHYISICKGGSSINLPLTSFNFHTSFRRWHNFWHWYFFCFLIVYLIVTFIYIWLMHTTAT